MSKFIDICSATGKACTKMILESVISTVTFDTSMKGCDKIEDGVKYGMTKHAEKYAMKNIKVKKGLFKTRYFDTKKNIEITPSEEIKKLLKNKK